MLPSRWGGTARSFQHLERSRAKPWALWVVALGSALSGAVVALAAAGLARHFVGAPSDTNPAAWTVRQSTVGGLTFEATRAEQALGELTPAEVRSVAAWVMGRSGAVPSRPASANLSWIAGPSGVELLLPRKREVLAFLSGAGPAPTRRARVTLVVPEGVAEYSVGPLEGGALTADAEMKLLRAPKDTPYVKRPTEVGADGDLCSALLERTYRTLAPVIVPAWGNIFPSLENFSGTEGYVQVLQRAETLTIPGQRSDFFKLLWTPPQKPEGFWLHPVPLDVKVNTTSHDPTKWHITAIYLCSRLFRSAEEVLEAWKKGSLHVCPLARTTGPWDTPQHETPPSPDGRTPMAKHGGVRWGPWSFTVTNRPSTGPALLDIKFRDERVLYELSMQDAAADYSGTLQTQFFYSDASWSLSMLGTSLEPGVDCPHGAYYLKTLTWVTVEGNGGTMDPSRARELVLICIFEWQEDHTLWRHMKNPQSVHGLVRGTVVVRSITTVGNYDYITDLKFREDGEIEVSTKFAGYIESRYFNQQSNPWERNFSTIMRGDLAGPVHSHLVCFKADIDVAGALNNTLSVTRVKAGSVQGLGDAPLVSKYLERSVIAEEGIGKSTFVADPRTPSSWAIVDRASAEASGNPRGYAISLNSFATVQVLPDSHPFVTAMPCTKYHLAVTRQHDDEYRVNSPYVHYDGYEADTSRQNLDRFLSDEENILDKDLVAWVSFGREHIVRQEDLPLVSNFGGGFSLQPWNFFERNIGASP